MKKIFLYTLAIVFPAIVFISCGDDDKEYPPSSLDFEVALVGSNLTTVEEGDTVFLTVGVFSGRPVESDVVINWSTQGSDTRSGSVVIPAGSISADITLPYADNTLVDADRPVTLTISTTDLPTTEEFGGTTISYEITDDLKSYYLGSNEIDVVDTLIFVEDDSVVAVSLNSSGAYDENTEFTFTVDPASTAVEGVDYELPDGTTFNLKAGAEVAPFFNIQFFNNETLDDPKFLKLNLTGITASSESSIVGTLTNSLVYKIVNDTTKVKIKRLEDSVPVNQDTLTITSAGQYQFSTMIEGGDITGAVIFEVNANFSSNPGISSNVSMSFDEVLYVPEEPISKPFVFKVDEDLFTEAGEKYYITFSLGSLVTNNGDNEVVFDPDGETSIVVEIIDAAPEE